MKKSKLSSYLPILGWLPAYKKSYLSGDLAAGITVGVLMIPQGMAYAMIAGLPPVYGLYTALVPQLVYAVFGTSPQLSVGPVAMDSILVAAGVTLIASVGTELYLSLAIGMCLMIGILQVLMGALKLGFIVNFLSKPVISGFTAAAALIIAINQIQHLSGTLLDSSNGIVSILGDFILKWHTINWVTLGLGAGAIVLILIGKRISKKIPIALVVVAVGTLVVYFGGLTTQVAVIGAIPEGLPNLTIPNLSWQEAKELLPISVTLALIGFMEAISIGKTAESRHKGEYKLDYNQEMLSLGLGNVFGSFFGSYTSTGSFSRTVVNDNAGAKTNLAALVSALLVGLTLLYFTPLFYHLPLSVLGAIILVAVIGLIDPSYPKHLLKVSKQDLMMYMGTFLVTLFFGIKEGILFGVLISVLALIYRTSSPHIAVLGQIPETTDFRNIVRFKNALVRKDVLIIRQDAQLYFANAAHFCDRIKKEVELQKAQGLQLVILDFSSVSSVDTTALEELENLIAELNLLNIGVYFASVIGPVRDFFHRTGFSQNVGESHFFTDIIFAIEYLERGTNHKTKQMTQVALQNNIFKEKQI